MFISITLRPRNPYIKKKIWFWIILLLILGGVIGSCTSPLGASLAPVRDEIREITRVVPHSVNFEEWYHKQQEDDDEILYLAGCDTVRPSIHNRGGKPIFIRLTCTKRR